MQSGDRRLCAAAIGACVVTAFAVAGCQGYRAGSFTAGGQAFAGERRTVGCLDIAAAPADQPAADGPVAAITFANRCDAAVAVDLRAIRAVAVTADGDAVRMRPYDPDREMRVGVLEARAVGREVIEYHAATASSPAARDLCLDLAEVDAGAPSSTPVVACLRGGAPGRLASEGGDR